MNVENILKVADAIEQHSIPTLGFNMASFRYSGAEPHDTSGHRCRTTACVGGWVLAVLDPNTWDRHPWDAMRASELLGLDDDHGNDLFFPTLGGTLSYGKAAPVHAVAVLRHLAKTGNVDWTIGAPVDA